MIKNTQHQIIKEINKTFKGTFVKFPLNHIANMVETAEEDGEETAPILLEYLDEEVGAKNTLEEATEIEVKLNQICSKYSDCITTEIVSAGYGYEVYFVVPVE